MKKFPFFDITNKARFFIIIVLSLFFAWGVCLLAPTQDLPSQPQSESVAYLHKSWASKITVVTNSNVKTITFTNTVPTRSGRIGNIVSVGSLEQNGSCGAVNYTSTTGVSDVSAYVFRNADDSTKYDIVLYAPCTIYAPTNSYDLFSDRTDSSKRFTSLKTIDFNGAQFDTSKATSMKYMFYKCESLTDLDLSNFNTSNVTDMSSMFDGCEALTSLDFSNFNTSNVKDMGFMFSVCSNLESLDLSSFDTSNVEKMRYMFQSCRKLSALNLENFNTSKVNDMQGMFRSCQNLTDLDLSMFDTSNVTNMSRMFEVCMHLTSLDLSSFDTSNVTDMSDMFSWCHYLDITTEMLTGFDTSKVTTMSGMFAQARPTFDLSILETNNVIDMSGMFSAVGIYSNPTKKIDLSGLNTSNVTNMSSMFSMIDFGDFEGFSSLDTSNATNMSYMFRQAYYMKSGNMTEVCSFDTAKVTNMSGMFSNLYGINGTSTTANKTLNLTGFNTSNVKNMSWMFSENTDLKKIVVSSSFDTSKVTDMTYMFAECTTLESFDFSQIETNSAPNMSYMFYKCSALANFETLNLNTANVTNMSHMFEGITNVSTFKFSENFDTSSVKNMRSMFHGCQGVTSAEGFGLASLETANVTDMDNMFSYCSGLRSFNFSDFDTSNVQNMKEMFRQCVSLGLGTVDFSQFKSQNATDMSYMFYDCKNLQIFDVSGFDTENVTDMSVMFCGCEKLTTLTGLTSFDTANVTDMGGMFSSCEALTSLDVSSFNTSNVTDMGGMFSGCEKLTTLTGLTSFNTANVTNMADMFRTCKNLSTLILSKFDTSKVDNMSSMFAGCWRLSVLDITNFNTENVVDMTAMFEYCISLSTIDLSQFNTASVTNMKSMFWGCDSLKDLDLSSFNTTKVWSMENMFGGCYSLKTIDVSSFNTANVTTMKGMFKTCTSLKKLDLGNFNMTKTYSVGDMLTASGSDVMNFQELVLPYNVRSGVNITFNNSRQLYRTDTRAAVSAISSANCSTATSKVVLRYGYGITYEVYVDGELDTTWSHGNIGYYVKPTSEYTYNFNTSRRGYDVVYSLKETSTSGITIENNVLKVPTDSEEEIVVRVDCTPATYNIIYNVNGGDALENDTFVYSQASQDIALKTPTKSGYVFDGWTIQTQGSGGTSTYNRQQNTLTVAAGVYSDITLIAKWETSYTISFDEGRGVEVADMFYVATTSGSQTKNLPSTTRNGYVFGGWMFDSASAVPSGATLSADKMMLNLQAGTRAQIFLKAIWTAIDYNVTVKPANGDADETWTYNIDEDNAIEKTLPTVTRNGHNFVEWCIENGFEGAVVDGSTLTISANTIGDFSVCAVWEEINYSISFDTNGGALEEGAQSLSYKINESQGQDMSLPNAERNGFVFNGWEFVGTVPTGISLTSTGKTLTVSAGAFGDVELKAIWTIVDYTITFDPNGGTIASSETLEYNIDETNPIEKTLPIPTRDGWDFVEWEVTTAPTGQLYLDCDSEKLTISAGTFGNVSLKAKWSAQTFEIWIDNNDGTAEYLLGSFSTSETLQSKTLPELTKDGWSFSGWTFVRNTQSGSIANGTNLTIPANAYGNIKLKAEWIGSVYNIVFDEKGGNTISDLTYQTSETEIQKDLEDISRNGFDFVGWEIIGESLPEGLKIENKVLKIPSNYFGNISLQAIWQGNEYNISYDANNGNIITTGYAESYVASDEEIEIGLPVAVRSGYNFVGWTIASNTSSASARIEGGKLIIPSGAYGNIVLQAVFGGNNYKIFYDHNDGGDTIDEQSYVTMDASQEIDLIEEISYYHENTDIAMLYSFDRWEFEDSLLESTLTMVGGKLTIPANFYGDIRLKAVWSGAEYSIVYESQFGEQLQGTIPTAYSCSATLQEFELPLITKNGATIIGWDANALSGGTYVSGNANDGFKLYLPANTYGDVTLSALWELTEYTISVDSAGGSAIALNGQKYTVSEGAQSFEFGEPTKPAYTFKEWQILQNSEGVSSSINSNTLTISAGAYGDIDIVAVWEAVVYDILIDKNNGSAAEKFADYTISGTEQTIALTVPTREYYEFLCWNITQNSSGQDSVIVGNVLTIPVGAYGKILLEASWMGEEYSIEFDSNGGNPIEAQKYLVSDVDQTIEIENEPYRNGYTFDVWAITTNTNGGKSHISANVLTIPRNATGEIVLQAKWIALSHIVEFNVNGGEPIAQETFKTSEEIQRFELDQPTRNGYEFEGWTISKNTDGAVSYIEDGQLVVPENAYGDIIVDAEWNIVVYSITFDVAGGTSVTTKTYTICESKQSIEIGTVEKFGHTLTGWTISGDNETEEGLSISENILTLESGVYGDFVLTANWTANVYDVELVLNNGSISLETNFIKVTYGQTYGILPVPSRSYDEFLGWYLDEEMTQLVSEDDIVTLAKNHKLYAKWKTVGFFETLLGRIVGGTIIGLLLTFAIVCLTQIRVIKRRQKVQQ